MNLVKRIAALLALGLFLSLAGAIGWAHYYLNSPRMGEKIRKIVSERFFTRLEFDHAQINLLSGLKVKEAKLFSREEPARELGSLKHVVLEYAPLSLLKNTIEVKTVRINSPTITFEQSKEGRWTLPQDPTAAKSEMMFKTGIFRFNILLDNLALENGRILVQDSKQLTLIEAQGVDINGQLKFIASKNDAQGDITIKTLLLGPYFQLTQLKSSFDFADSVLKLPKLSGSVHGGNCHGTAQINTGIGGPNFLIDLVMDNVNLSSLLKASQGNAEFIQGQLKLNTQITGDLNEPLLMQGTGTIEVGQAKLTGIVALDKLGLMLNLPQLRYTQFDSIRGSFKVAEQKTTFYELEAKSPDLTLTATGSMGFDRSLDFDVLLILSPELAAQIPPSAEAKFGKRENGARTVTFKISGTFDDPQSNLSEKLSLSPSTLEPTDQASLNPSNLTPAL